MTKFHSFKTYTHGQQVVRTSTSLVIAAVLAGMLGFASDANAQTDRAVRQQNSSDESIALKQRPARGKKSVAARKTVAVEKQIAVQPAAAVQNDIAAAPEPAAPVQVTLVALQSVTSAQTEVVAQAVAAAATDVAATKAAEIDPVATDPTEDDANAKKDPDGNTGCTVCHKNRTNITLPCNSVALRRHQAHGDYNGPCVATRGSREE